MVTGNTSAWRGKAAFAGFAPTKAAQRILAESLARALGPKGVHVAYVVIDAVIDVPWTRSAFADRPDEFFIEPAGIAEAVHHLVHAAALGLDLRARSPSVRRELVAHRGVPHDRERIARGLEVDGLHPVRVQLRHRGAARRRGRPAARARARRRRASVVAGYACEKPSRLDFYQNGPHRLTKPLRRRADGTFEEIDWDTAIREVAARFAAVRDAHGGESIFYYGGGGQGNHLPGAYGRATRRVLGSRYRSSALAQEKTGEFWVANKMVGGYSRGDFEHCEVALFLGKNPWFSHSIPRARVTLREIANDPARTLIVVDPRRTETAEIADIHLQVKPGTDALLLAALIGVLVQEGLDRARLARRARRRPRAGPAALRSARRRRALRRSAACPRSWCATPRGASRPRRASPPSRISACR